MAKKYFEKQLARYNKVARQIQQKTDTDSYTAIKQAATQCNLTEVHSDDDTIIYRDANGKLVNAWVNFDKIEDGGAGFDDQVEWYTEQ